MGPECRACVSSGGHPEKGLAVESALETVGDTTRSTLKSLET